MYDSAWAKLIGAGVLKILLENCIFIFGLTGASFGENFYGLKRTMADGTLNLTSSAQRKSLIFLVSIFLM